MTPQDDDGWNLMMEVAARLDEEARQQQAEQSSCSAFVVSEAVEPQCPLDHGSSTGVIKWHQTRLARRVRTRWSTVAVPSVVTTNTFWVDDDEKE